MCLHLLPLNQLFVMLFAKHFHKLFISLTLFHDRIDNKKLPSRLDPKCIAVQLPVYSSSTALKPVQMYGWFVAEQRTRTRWDPM